MSNHPQVSSASTPPKSPVENPKKSSKYIYYATGTAVLILMLAGAYLLGRREVPPNSLLSSLPPSSNIGAPTPSATNQPSSADLFTGKVRELKEDLGLIQTTEEEKLNNITPKIFYYEAGTYTRGNYQGYTRYIAVRQTVDPSGPGIYIFASKDQKSYVLDQSLIDENLYNEDPLFELDKSKIGKIDQLESEHSAIIPLSERFSLNRDGLFVDTRATNKKDQYGNSEYEEYLLTDFFSYKSLSSTNPQLKFYQGIHKTNTPQPEDQYIEGTTKVVVVDSTGLPYLYDLANPQQAKTYPQVFANYKTAYAEYIKKPAEIKSPEYPQRPNLRLAKQDIQVPAPIYDTYDLALPAVCANDVSTLVAKNLLPQELEKIGTSINGDLFVIKDKNHILNKTEYDRKIGVFGDKPDDLKAFSSVNNRQKPTYDEYFAKPPLILFKDYWDRWVMLGEYDYKLLGGCGKPVIYLYPPKPSKVQVRFNTPIEFDLSIPTYHDGWTVMAYPNGDLVDLQSQYTSCTNISTADKGSEYAGNACQKNVYPYLYWAGQSLEKPYPQITQGWIVERSQLADFLSQKLDQIGFNQNEKQDMISYWLPEMLGKNTAYYKISFLQTSDMNKIAPMHIDPQPKSVYRLFLDYLPLVTKPSYILEPQDLAHVVRDGFTVVEWGGLKR